MMFLVFCLILGMVVGGLLVWFLIADHPFESRETPGGPVDPIEAGMIALQMQEAGSTIDEATVKRVLELHTSYVVGRIREEQRRAELDAAVEEARAAQRAAKPSTAPKPRARKQATGDTAE
jgi:hypothetical protein